MDKLTKEQLADLEMLAMFKLQDVNKARLLALELMASAGGRDLVDLRFRAEQLLKDVNRWWVTRETLGRMLDQAIEAEGLEPNPWDVNPRLVEVIEVIDD